jgi:hypothetical protein
MNERESLVHYGNKREGRWGSIALILRKRQEGTVNESWEGKLSIYCGTR